MTIRREAQEMTSKLAYGFMLVTIPAIFAALIVFSH